MPRVAPEGTGATRGWLSGRLSRRKSSLSELDSARVVSELFKDDAVKQAGDAWGRLLRDTLPQVDATLRLRELDVSHASSTTTEKQAVFAHMQTLVTEFSAALGERPCRRSAATWEATMSALAEEISELGSTIAAKEQELAEALADARDALTQSGGDADGARPGPDPSDRAHVGFMAQDTATHTLTDRSHHGAESPI